MWRVTLEGLRARRLRLALTAAAVVLGVAFVSGTFVLTDSLAELVDDELSTFTGGDVVVRSTSAFESGSTGDRARIPSSIVPIVRDAPGVAAAEGVVLGSASLVTPGGELIDEPIPFGLSWTDDDALSPLDLRDGRKPAGDDEVAVDVATARRFGLEVGDRISILTLGPAEGFEIVGLAGFAGGDGRAFSSVAAFAPATADRVFEGQGGVDLIAAAAEPDVTDEELEAALLEVLIDQPGLEVVTTDALGEESSAVLRQNLAFVEVLLLVFAGVGLVVGAFVIQNTFSTLVAQRTRELALLRALGASNAQVRISVLGEALIVGVVASIVGLLAGFGLAVALEMILETVGLDVPRGAAGLRTRTVVVAIAVGVVVTMVAAWWPARRAARVSPVEALQTGLVTTPPRPLRRRAIAGVAVIVLGGAMVFAGLLEVSLLTPLSSAVSGLDDPRIAVPIGAGLLVGGLLVVAPALAGLLTTVFGAPLPRLGGIDGHLARENARRHPRRTAATAAALVIGVTLVTFVSVLASSANASVAAAIDEGVRADWVLRGPQFTGVSPEVARTAADLPEIDEAMGMKLGFVGLGSTTQALYSVDPARLDQLVDVDLAAGSLDGLAAGGVLVHEQEAEDFGLGPGDTVLLQFSVTGAQPVPVAGVYRSNGFTGNFVVNLLLGEVAFQQHFGEELDSFVYARTAPGVDPSSARAAMEAALVDFPNVEIETPAEFTRSQRDQVNRVLAVFYMLLALAVVIAAFGIVNTLLLSVHERTREIGLLRTVGMTTRQVGAMIRWESLLVAVTGAVVGVILGFVAAWSVVATLHEDGIDRFSVRWVALAIFVVAAAVVGVLAGVLPARRAARLDLLDAVAEE